MQLHTIVLVLFLVSCSNSAESNASSIDPACPFDFGSQPDCTQGDMRVSVKSDKTAQGVLRLLSLEVSRSGKRYVLAISPDVTLVSGDQGLISFEDINFDGVPDIAVSTSFGIANLYMDYWVFDVKKNKFSPIGNHCRFSLDRDNKTLSNRVKLSAATYENNKYYWQGSRLIKVVFTNRDR